MKNLSYSFAPGLKKVALGEQECLKNAICGILDIKNRHVFCRKKKSIVNISKTHYDEITALFASHGVSESEVWSIVAV